MNIWIFNHYAHGPDLPGGTRHYDLGRELVRRGHRVTIFATSFHHYLHKETRLRPGERWKVEDIDGVKFVWIRTPPYRRNDRRRVWNMVVFMFRSWWLGKRMPIKSEIGRPDVIIGSSVHLLTVFAAYRVAKRHGAKLIMEVRDLWPQTLIDMGELSEHHPITKALRFLEKFLYQRAEKIITLLPRAHEYITKCGIPLEKIEWIPNGVDLSKFNGLDSTETGGEDFRVMYLGAHGRANALDVIVDAAKVVQDRGYRKIKFILVGDGPEKPRLIEMVRGLDLHNVEFCDPVPKDHVPKVLKSANSTVLVLQDIPLYKYGISLNKLFDYLAIGRPLILAGKPVNNPVQEANCGLTVPPRNPQALADAVIKLYQMPEEKREAMGRRGREYVEKYHAIPVLADKLERVLKEVVGEG